MKKLAIIGRGTAGAYSVTHFLRNTDWEIEWYFDSKTAPQAVGEGSTLEFPIQLFDNMRFGYGDMSKIDATLKLGIQKSGWGNTGKEFMNWFSAGFSAYHFNANKLQDYILDFVQKSNRVKIFDQRITSYDDIDCDFIMDCSGKPSDEEMDQFVLSDSIPVNSVYVTQCYWEKPEFNYSLNLAREHGWVFGIPLRNRCSIGYMYNNTTSTLDEVKENVKQIFDEYNLTPSDTTNSFSFKNYYRKQNFYKRVCFNGNASFFLEPIEATSIYFTYIIQIAATEVWLDGKHFSLANRKYNSLIKEFETMIMYHYFKNNVYKSKFWEFAQARGTNCIKRALVEDQKFRKIVTNIVKPDWKHPELIQPFMDGYGTWAEPTFYNHAVDMDIMEELKQFLEETKNSGTA